MQTDSKNVKPKLQENWEKVRQNAKKQEDCKAGRMWDEMQEIKSRIWDRNARMNARNVEKCGTKCKN